MPYDDDERQDEDLRTDQEEDEENQQPSQPPPPKQKAARKVKPKRGAATSTTHRRGEPTALDEAQNMESIASVRRRKATSEDPDNTPDGPLCSSFHLPLHQTINDTRKAGIRRSSRVRIEPLEFWRNERVVYSRRSSGVAPHYGIKGVVRIPKPDIKPLAHTGKAGSRHRSLGPRAKGEPDDDGALLGGTEVDPYIGYDQHTEAEGIVVDYVSEQEIKRRERRWIPQSAPNADQTLRSGIAVVSATIDPQPSDKSSYRFQKIFTDGDFMAGGMLEIPVGDKKPLKPARDNSYVRFLCFLGSMQGDLNRLSV